MKVAIINKSDNAGGAAVVSVRLTHALREAGVEASMLVTHRALNDPAIVQIGSPLANAINFLTERAEIAVSNGFTRHNLFAIDTGSRGTGISSCKQVREADVVVLNWLNQGTVSLSGVRQLVAMGKPVVWVMHDMWNCTGICHHAHECRHYTTVCKQCPLLRHPGERDLSTAVWKKKKSLYSAGGIHFVAVSNWLADCCRRSTLMRDAPLSVIPNAFPVEQFTWQRDDSMGLNPTGDKRVIVMGARRLDEPVKGFGHMLAALEHISINNPALAKRLHIVLYGDIRDKDLLNRIPIGHTWLGPISDTEALSRVYRNGDIVLSTSLFENLPGTLIEGAASGCVPVSYLRGGQADIIEHLHTGYLAEWNSAESLAKGIAWAASRPVERQSLHAAMDSRFNSHRIAEQYISLFNQLITNKQPI